MQTYRVLPGDSLSKIAAGMYGDPQLWKLIWEINPQITDPDKIYPGQIINVPEQKDFLRSGNAGPAADTVQSAVVLESKLLTDEQGKKAGNWFAWGIVLLAAALLGSEALKERKKQKKKAPAAKKG